MTIPVPSVFKAQNAVSLAASPGTAVWTPATGKRFRLIRLLLASSLAGNIVLTDGSGGVVLAVVPVVAAGAGVPLDLGSLGYLSDAVNNALYAYSSAGAATLSGTLAGTEE